MVRDWVDRMVTCVRATVLIICTVSLSIALLVLTVDVSDGPQIHAGVAVAACVIALTLGFIVALVILAHRRDRTTIDQNGRTEP